MKQRLGIAAALLNDPKLLLLDEPSNGLDPAGIVAMRDTLRNLADAGKTVFVSSHLLGEVQQMVDVIGIISAGRLVREGPIENLLSGGGIVRVRVERNDVERSIGVLAGIAGPDGATASTAEPGWISVRTTADRIGEVNRVLAGADIWASGLESGPGAVVPGADRRRASRRRRGNVLRRRGRRGRRGSHRSGDRGMRVFASGLRKLGRRLATWVTFGLLAGLLVLILIAVGATSDRAGASTAQRAAALGLITFPGAYDSILSFILGLGGLFGVVYGAAIAGSEWTWGTLKNAVARGESRAR
jgi:hypothetical protein